jgi:hypothetical protein
MNAVLSAVGLSEAPYWMRELEVSLGWSWDEWAFGFCREFVDLGTAALVIGPLHVTFDWAIF